MSRVLVAALSLVLLLQSSGFAQNTQSLPNGVQAPPAAPQATLPQQRSFMVDESEIALSADTINGILRNEPGLLLQVKRMLARKAAEQGRVLYLNELTDEATYRLIESSPVIRALATQEMVARGYLTVRPTEQEASNRERQKQLAEATARRRSLAIEREDQALRQAATAQAEAGKSVTVPPIPRESDVDTSAPISPDQLPGLLSTGMPGQAGLGAASMGPGAGMGMGAGGLGGLGGGFGLPTVMPSEVPEPAPEPQQTASIPRRPMPNEARQPSVSERSIVHRANPYANVPSLYDLYAQARPATGSLERFGLDIFRDPSGNLSQLPMDLPVGPEYVLGPGDGIKLELWGSVSQRLQRVVDRSGRVALPEVGTIQVAGRSLGDVQREVQTVLRTQFRDVQADLSLNRIRSVRVYIVGDVSQPGAYDISSLSTPLNAVYAAGGPTENGSMRRVRHLRNRNLVEEVDLYDLLLNGTRSDLQTLQPGDTILVPPVGPQVAIEGMVRRPAVYEVSNEATLAQILQLAGGVLPSGTLRSIEVERLEAHERHTMLRLNLPESNNPAAVDQQLTEFRVQDGDRVRISPILPYSEKTVYLDGHVFRPGKYAYSDGMKVTDLIKGFGDLLPEPSQRHAEIIRLQAPDYRPVVLAFNLGDALGGQMEPPALQPFDTLRIFGRYDFEDPPVIVVGGEVRDPGEHRTNGEVHLRDAIYLAGGLTPDAQLSDAQVFRRNPDGSMRIFDVNLSSALSGDPAANLLIRSRDRIIVHRNLAKVDPPTVSVEGEVASPGKYPLGAGMTASELVRTAGGLKRSAFTEAADLSRYLVQNEKRILGEHQEVAIAKALSGDPGADIALRDGDVLTVRRIGGWDDIGAGVTVAGEVLHPGTYGIREGERLSSVLKRAGGLRSTAYAYGAVLERVQVRELGEKARQDMIRRIEAGQGLQDVRFGLSSSPGEQAAVVQAAAAQQQQVLAGLKSQPASGRMVISISDDFSRWEGTSSDIELRAGDVISVPKRPNFVLVSGQVYNSSAITYREGKDAEWYLRQSGGVTSLANKKAIFIIRANGSIVGEGSTSNWWGGGVLSTQLRPGDTIVVPEKIITGSPWLRDLLTSAQLVSSLALAAGVIANF